MISSQKMTLKAAIHLSMLITSYPDEVCSIQPPQGVMRLLAALGRLLQYHV